MACGVPPPLTVLLSPKINRVNRPETDTPEPNSTHTQLLRLNLGMKDKPSLGIVLCLAMLSMLGAFSIDMVFPGFPAVGRDFNADSHQLHQVTSLYLFAFAGMSLFHGSLSDALGRKRVMTVALLIYMAASLGAALSPTLVSLIIFRIVQGLSAGGATIVGRVIIRDLYSGGTAQRLTSQVMLVFALAPALAPIIGGWILYFGTWRWVFFALFIYSTATLLVMVTKIPETLPPEARRPFRLGSILAALWRVLATPRMMLLGLAGIASQGFFMYISSAPVIIPTFLGFGEQSYWVLFIPIISGMMLGNLTVGRLAFSASRSALISAAFGVLLLAHLLGIVLPPLLLHPGLTELTALPVMVGPFLAGLGAALMMAPLQLEVIDLFPQDRGAATSVASFLNLMTAALIAGVAVPLLQTSMSALAAGALVMTLVGAASWGAYVVLARRA